MWFVHFLHTLVLLCSPSYSFFTERRKISFQNDKGGENVTLDEKVSCVEPYNYVAIVVIEVEEDRNRPVNKEQRSLKSRVKEDIFV